MPELTVRETLVQVRELLLDPRRWIQGDDAQNVEGRGAMPTDPHAVCWCLDGALGKVTSFTNERGREVCFGGESYETAHKYLEDLILDRAGHRSIIAFNDRSSHEDVIYLLDEAIESCSP